MAIPQNAQFAQGLFGTSMTYYALDVGVGVRPCLTGEGLRSNGACYKCAKGTFLIQVPVEPTECKECPSERAWCLGGDQIGPKEGYWRKNNETEEFQKCPIPTSCLGSSEPDWNPKGDCTEGTHGALCTGCLPGYARTGDFGCNGCPDPKMNVLRISGIFIAVVIAVVFLVK